MNTEIIRRGGRVVAGLGSWGLGDAQPPGRAGPWPPIPTTFPTATNDVQKLAQDQIAAAEQYMQANAASLFGQLATQSGVSAADWQKASLLIGTYGSTFMHAANDVLTGNVSIQDVQAVLGAAMQIAGATPVVGLAVSAGLSIVSSLAGMLTPGACANCGGRCIAGSSCISGTTLSGKPLNVQPSGPSDPYWLTWEDALTLNLPLGYILPFYQSTIGCEMPNLDKNDPVQAFFYTYYVALQRAAEYTLNGLSAPTPWDVFTQTQTSWNAAHSGPAVQLVETPAPMVPVPFIHSTLQCVGGGVSIGKANDPNGISYIGALLAGSVDGVHHGPSANGTPQSPGGINIGPSAALPPRKIIELPGGTPVVTTSGSGSASTGTKIATGVAVAGALGAGGLYAYAHYSGQSMMQVLKSLRFW
jgi:hypothetical protein